MTQLISQRIDNNTYMSVTGHWDISEIPLKTQGEIKAAICERISRLQQDSLGRRPKDIRAHLIGDLLVVRLQGVLTAAEQHLVKSLTGEKGRELLKRLRTHLIETARPILETPGSST